MQNKLVVVLDMLQDGTLEMVTVNGMDVIYNPHMNGGEWEIFNHDDDHTEYKGVTDIFECSEFLCSLG